MKLLTTTAAVPFTLRITRTRRRAVVNEVAETITLSEVTTTLTLTLPSVWRGVRDAAARIGNRFQRAADDTRRKVISILAICLAIIVFDLLTLPKTMLKKVLSNPAQNCFAMLKTMPKTLFYPFLPQIVAI